MRRWLYVSIALTLVALAASLVVYQLYYDSLPARIPTHWDLHFQPDGWTPKEGIWKVFFLLPLVMAGICVLTVILPWLSPRHFQVDRFRNTYGYVMMLVVALMGYMHLAILWAAVAQAGQRTVFTRLFLGGLCLFFALIGNVMGKLRRNFWMGVRTPWTIASEQVWNQTHGLAAWLFVAAGLMGLVTAFCIPEALSSWAAVIILACIMAAALIPVVYSLVLYKRLERAGKLESAGEESESAVLR